MVTMGQLQEFILNHWPLCLLFVVAIALLMVEEARSKGFGRHVSSAMLVNWMNRDEVFLIDSRGQVLYEAGHLIGAKWVPLADIDKALKQFPSDKEKNIVVVTERGMADQKYLKNLKQSGYKNIMVLKGGMFAWKEANMPVVKGKKAS